MVKKGLKYFRIKTIMIIIKFIGHVGNKIVF